jgi:transposase
VRLVGVTYDQQTLMPFVRTAMEKAGLEGVCQFFVTVLNEQEARHREELAQMEARHQAVVARLEARIAELEKRLGKNSSNSSKPPSSDGLQRRSTSLRNDNSERKVGGQLGHVGRHLVCSENPDKVIEVHLAQCPQCQANLSAQPVAGVVERQVFELPSIKLEVIAYRAERKRCPKCASTWTARFPEGVEAPTQYGANMQAVMTYLQAGQLLPHERTAQVCEDLFGHRPSAGSVVRSVARSAEKMQGSVEQITESLKHSNVLHADETGIRCAGKTHWLHVVSNEQMTLYTHSAKRGLEGIQAAGVLGHYKEKLMHDFWGPYDKLEHCTHLRCNAHLLRELKACVEDGHHWAKELIGTLVAMKQARDQARESKQSEVPPHRRRELEEQYEHWVFEGLSKHPAVEKPKGRPGRSKQSSEHNLLKRLESKQGEITAFLHDLSLPFDNNLAERDLRIMKVQQKISGCFRSEAGAKAFCVVRSYLSTARKQGLNLLTAIRVAIIGPDPSYAQGAE